jgi:hypothetical protein
MNARRKLLLLGVTALVLLPFWWAGATGRGAPWLPWQVREVWAFAQLFTGSVPSWSSRHVQLLGRDGRWHEVDQDPPFQATLFGSQTRLDWLLIYLGLPTEHPRDVERRETVYRHLCQTYAQLYDASPLAQERLPAAALPIQRVRLVHFERASSTQRPPATRYSRRLPGALRPDNHEILTECALPAEVNTR